jgi:hypothetical protein
LTGGSEICCGVGGVGDSEVADFQLAAVYKEQVAGLDISVDDVAVVRSSECLSGLRSQRNGLIDRQAGGRLG